MALGASAVVLAGFFFYVERDVFDIYVGYIAALAGGGTALVRIIAQFFSKSNPALAELVAGPVTKPGSQPA